MKTNFEVATAEPLVLIIDDNAGVRRVLTQLAGAVGMRAAVAQDGIKGLEFARTMKPDLVILDVRMPGPDGCSVCADIRRDPATRNIPVLMLSGLGAAEDELRALDNGADDYVAKPFRLDELVSRIEALLRRRSR